MIKHNSMNTKQVIITFSISNCNWIKPIFIAFCLLLRFKFDIYVFSYCFRFFLFCFEFSCILWDFRFSSLFGRLFAIRICTGASGAYCLLHKCTICINASENIQTKVFLKEKKKWKKKISDKWGSFTELMCKYKYHKRLQNVAIALCVFRFKSGW